MKNFRVLHLASFDGNVGDNANHSGFYAAMAAHAGLELDIDPLEIREFYWKQRFFDDDFVDLANTYDLLVIGGGNYFELWVEHSPTGTSVMIEPERFARIRVPVLFNALGVDPAQGASRTCCDRFRSFLTQVLDDEKNLVSIRNDGSSEAMREYVGADLLDRMLWTPDAGVLVEIDSQFRIIEPGIRYVAINIAGDMLDTRFPGTEGRLSSEQFFDVFTLAVQELLEIDGIDEVVFQPHIHKDVAVTNEILRRLPDPLTRRAVSIGPLLHGRNSDRRVFAIYGKAILNLSMRFHANLCSIGLGRPTLGLANYRQIRKLYEEAALEEYFIDVTQHGFDERLVSRASQIVTGLADEQDKFLHKATEMKGQYRVYAAEVVNWLDRVTAR